LQFGVLLALEQPMRRKLQNLKLWAGVVLVNTMIMTVYLWHLTVMIIIVALLYLFGGVGLGVEPGTTEWWLTRPLWILFLMAVLVPVALPMSAFERRGRDPGLPVPSSVRQVGGAMLLCLGIAFLARFGYGGGPIRHFDLISFALVIIGAAMSGLLTGFAKRVAPG